MTTTETKIVNGVFGDLYKKVVRDVEFQGYILRVLCNNSGQYRHFGDINVAVFSKQTKQHQCRYALKVWHLGSFRSVIVTTQSSRLYKVLTEVLRWCSIV